MSAGHGIIFLREGSPQHGLHPEDFKIVAGDKFAVATFVLPAITEVNVDRIARCNTTEDFVVIPDVAIHRVGERIGSEVQAPVRSLAT